MVDKLTRKPKIRDLLLVAILIFSIAAIAHFWITDRLGVLRVMYPAQAAIAELTLRCSKDAPDWMRSSIRHSISRQSSLSNQLSYITPAGQVHHCESGWQGRMLMSPRVDQQTRFRYASLTKLLTADAILQQVLAGKLALDSSLEELLPEVFPAADERLASVTLGQLLNHSAGFDRLRTPDIMAIHNKKPWCPYDLSSLSTISLDFSPGEKRVYSNLGYCLLGVVLENTVRMPYREWIAKEYDLHKMNIRFVDGDYYSDEVRYDFRNSNFYGENYSRYFDFFALSSSAGLSGSAVALASVIKNKLVHSSLSVTSAADMTYCDPAKLNSCFGYGPFRYQQANNKLSIHVQRGFLYGASSTALIDDQGGVAVWLGNGMSLENASSNGMTEYLYAQLSNFYR